MAFGTASAQETHEQFIVGDFLLSPHTYDEWSPGNSGLAAGLRAGAEFRLFNLPWLAEGDFRWWQYPHDSTHLFGVQSTNPCPLAGEQGCVTLPAGLGQYFFPAFVNQEDDVDIRLSYRIARPRIYAGVSYLIDLNQTRSQFRSTYPSAAFCYPVSASTSFVGPPWCGAPSQSGLGVGVDKLPDFERVLSPFGSAWYFPNMAYHYPNEWVPTAAGIVKVPLVYTELKYQFGLTYSLRRSRAFFELGYDGDAEHRKANSPVSANHGGAFLGVGYHTDRTL